MVDEVMTKYFWLSVSIRSQSYI